MDNFNTRKTEDTKEEWYTPPSLITALGDFDLDVCICEDRNWNTAKNHMTKKKDGLIQDWFGRVWCNPPYGRETFKWLNKLSRHGNGIALIFARTETIGFHEEIWSKADAVFFFKGRLKFYHKDGTEGGVANAPSCLVAYGMENVHGLKAAIKNEKIKGKLIILKETNDT